jgi:uncharacterized membrane protein
MPAWRHAPPPWMVWNLLLAVVPLVLSVWLSRSW